MTTSIDTNETDGVVEPVITAPPSRGRQSLRDATTMHLLTLAVGALFLVWIGRTHWFVADEWAFITKRGVLGGDVGLFMPHMQHWVTGPVLIYRALLNVFGLHTYLPFLVTGVIVHLVVVHLAWRVAIRAGADAWCATGLAAVLLVASATAQQALLPFQITLNGSVAFGLGLLLLADRTRPPSVRWGLFTAVVAVISLTFSAISVPLILVAAVVLWVRQRILIGLAVFAPSGIVFAAWYELVGRDAISSGAGSAQINGTVLRRLPGFAWRGLSHALGEPLEINGFFGGVLLAVILAIVLFLFFRSVTGPGLIAIAAAGGAVLFFTLTAVGRANFGPTASRYLYVGAALLLPVTAVAVGLLWSRGAAVRTALVVVIVGLVLVNAVDLRRTAIDQAGVDQRLRREILTVASVVEKDQRVPGEVVPQIQTNPDITVAKMRSLMRSGWFPAGRVDPSVIAWASAYPDLDVSSHALPDGGLPAAVVPIQGAPTVQGRCARVPDAPTGRLLVQTQGPASVRLRSATGTQVLVWQSDAAGHIRGMVLAAPLPPGRDVYLNIERAEDDVIVPYYGTFTACGLTSTDAASTP